MGRRFRFKYEDFTFGVVLWHPDPILCTRSWVTINPGLPTEAHYWTAG